MNSVKPSTKEIMSSLIWKLLERGGTQGVQFVVQIIIARLLMPEDYGIISIVMIFVSIANVFIQSGFSTALIQKKNVDELDYSSVFYVSLLSSIGLYIIIFISSPYIAQFYNNSLVSPVLRVLALTLFFGVFNSIQNAKIARNLEFKKLFLSSIAGTLISGFIGLVAAYKGLGVWALVLQQLLNQAIITAILWFTVDWKPKAIFSLTRVKKLFSFGSKLLLSSLIDTVDREIRSLIIGRIYSPAILGYFNRGKQFPQFIVGNIDGSIQSVMLPTLSQEQDNIPRVKEMVRRSIVTSSYLVFPMMIGLAVIAEPLVIILLTEKWLPSVPFIQIFCLSFSLWPIHSANLQAINALGRSDIFLKLEVLKKILGLIILLISLKFGVYGIALGSLFSGIISSIINVKPNAKLLNYNYVEQWRDIVPSLVLSLLMGAIISVVKWLPISAFLMITLQIALGIFVYVLLSYIFKLESYHYLINTIGKLLKKN